MKYRKKPVVIEAIQFTGKNEDEINAFLAGGTRDHVVTTEQVHISTLEGTMRADLKDWIIKGVKGEFYPCKPDIFEATYEQVTDAA